MELSHSGMMGENQQLLQVPGIEKIRAFAFDVDGVMTDGGILALDNGDLYRTFNAKDAFGMRMAASHGFILGVITGGRSDSIVKRMKICGVQPENVYLGSHIKLRDFNDFCSKNGLKPEEVMYFGDDVPDIPVLKASGIGACPADAVPQVQAAADYVSPFPGGKLCIRDTLETIVRSRGLWEYDAEAIEKIDKQ